jgi:hypothetical protein
MKALSVWQPWASLIAIGAKRIETRGWSTAYRGPLAIHAAKRMTVGNSDFALSNLCQPVWHAAGLTWPFPLGAIVAVARLAICVPVEAVGELAPRERTFGDYRPGRFAFVLTDIRRIEPAIPWRGAKGLFDMPDSALASAL